MSCAAVTAQNSVWQFCPNQGADYFFIVMFGIVLCAHTVQMVVLRKVYSIAIVLSALLQFMGYIFRELSIVHPASTTLFAIWFVITLVAPIMTNAYCYMLFGRMVHNFIPDQKIWNIPARRLNMIFGVFNVIAFFIQTVGAIIASSGRNIAVSRADLGLHIYMGGISLQQLFNIGFIGLAVKYQLLAIKTNPLGEKLTRALRLLYVLYAVLFLITIRVIFRLVEHAGGLKSTASQHEVYLYVFDTAPMWIAILLFNLVQPGQYMPGKESDFPSRKEHRQELEKNNASAAFRSIDNLEDTTQYVYHPKNTLEQYDVYEPDPNGAIRKSNQFSQVELKV